MLPVQFITHYTSEYSYEDSARIALQGGCRWIQLRMKSVSDSEFKETALRIQTLCKDNEATFIIDDRVEIAKEIHADGVHLGKKDMPITKARSFLGEEFIIGGTANTIGDVEHCIRSGADYIGCGPFRFTTTKEGLSPVLGLEGYQHIMDYVKEKQWIIPICAIGGITFDDIQDIMATGINGIALSGSILHAQNPTEEMRKILNIEI